MKRVRTHHFFVTGAIGGLLGFFLMELVRQSLPRTESGGPTILASGLQFAIFGLALGAALGITEAMVQKRFRRLLYGLFLGLTLGTVGGLGGGVIGETIFQLLPQNLATGHPGTDLSIALDASGSMRKEAFFGFFKQGNDIDGRRFEAAEKVVGLLQETDRVAIIAFNDTAQTLLPLTSIDSRGAKKRVYRAIRGVGNDGGTNLSAGLHAALEQLTAQATDQSQHVIFLTDGVGDYQPAVIQPAIDNHIKIHTIGLGSGVNQPLLEQIAKSTGGSYYPVGNADNLTKTFERIYQEEIHVDMAGTSQADQYDPILLFLFRLLSWAAMGLVIGIGQGIRENTREDLRACSLGGLTGGLVGGAAFHLIVSMVSFGGGIFGRVLAGVVVGSCIGGSMRFTQGLVVAQDQATRSLTTILPEKSSSLVSEPLTTSQTVASGKLRATGMKGLVLSAKEAIERDGEPRLNAEQEAVAVTTPADDASLKPPVVGRRKPLSFYRSRYPDNRPRAMAAAFQSGHYSTAEIAEFFEVAEPRVRRSIEQCK